MHRERLRNCFLGPALHLFLGARRRTPVDQVISDLPLCITRVRLLLSSQFSPALLILATSHPYIFLVSSSVMQF